MHPVLQRAQQSVDQAELFWKRDHSISVRYENYALQQVTENDTSETSLRVIQQGKLGTAYAVFPDQPDYLETAILAAKYGDPATFSFASPAQYPSLEHTDERTAQLTSSDLIEICEGIKAKVRRHLPDVALAIGAHRSVVDRSVQTTHGADAQDRGTGFGCYFGAPFSGAGIGVFRSHLHVSPEPVSDELVEEFIEWYGWGRNTSTPSTGRHAVLLAPQAAFLLLLPLLAGVGGDAVWKKTSPLTERMGEAILSDRLTIRDHPLQPNSVHARRFDDEGVPCAERVIVENGVLKEFLFDQRIGAAMGRSSTGNGFKRALFGGGNETPITPWFGCPAIDTGTASWRDMLQGMKDGLLITGGMGFHSGNYPQGQFAVQAVGFHVVNGTVVGRLDKTMISANIYEDGQRIAAVSRETAPGGGFLSMGDAPYILFDALQVAGA